jgi:hypothetical protein
VRSLLKSIIPQKLWPFFRAVDVYVIYLLFVYFAIKRVVVGRLIVLDHALRQKVMVLRCNISLCADTGTDTLAQTLIREGLAVFQGRHTVYIASKNDIDRISAGLRERYWQQFGVKIIKSRQMAVDGTPYYTSSQLAPASTWFSMFAVGSVAEKMVVSNLLHLEGVAPRVIDLVKFESHDGTWRYAQIVEHVGNKVVTGEQGVEFMRSFTNALKTLGLETMSIKEHSDLRPPDFRGNILCDEEGHCRYVDIQNFIFKNNVKIRSILSDIKKRYEDYSAVFIIEELIKYSFYKRKSINLAEILSDKVRVFLQNNRLEINRSIIIDSGEDFGFFSMLFLHLGASWCTLLRGEEDHQLIEEIFIILGYSRFSVVTPSSFDHSTSRNMPHSQRTIMFIEYKDDLLADISHIDHLIFDALVVLCPDSKKVPSTFSLKSFNTSLNYIDSCDVNLNSPSGERLYLYM